MDLMPSELLPTRSRSLAAAFDAGDLKFFSSLNPLQVRDALLRYIAPIRKRDWVVYAKQPFAGPDEVLKYVARYTHRVAISNNRLLDIDNGKVAFHSKGLSRWQPAQDDDAECRRIHPSFLLHVLPDGFQRIRYFGFLANRYRAENPALCRQLMQMPPPQAAHEAPKDYRNRYEALTGISLKTCPLCRCGTMVVVEVFECTSGRALVMDSS